MLDSVTWQNPEDFAASRAEGASLPGTAAFFVAMASSAGSEEGVGPEVEDVV
ncbi:hypothetical protein AB0I51_37315 [Streptomyces sp. NPDC050549]|uniref:hypothetical protein n=1 Tax=Streptomyces sp. NPDC050549 TaxID=3155406 RepID=UPI00341AD10D